MNALMQAVASILISIIIITGTLYIAISTAPRMPFDLPKGVYMQAVVTDLPGNVKVVYKDAAGQWKYENLSVALSQHKAEKIGPIKYLTKTSEKATATGDLYISEDINVFFVTPMTIGGE